MGPNRALKKSSESRPVHCLPFQGNGSLCGDPSTGCTMLGGSGTEGVLMDRERERELGQGEEN